MAKIHLPTGKVITGKEKEWSNLQKIIFDVVSDTHDNIIIQARAGSGKTTTLVECARRIPKEDKVLFMAFNKNIVTELGTKLPYNVECKTLHALALDYCKKGLDRFTAVSNWKISNIMQAAFNMADKEEEQLYYAWRKPMSQIVGLLKANNIQYTASKYYVDSLWQLQDDEKMPEFFWKVYQHCEKEFFTPRVNGKRYEIDFDDMLYIAVNQIEIQPSYDCIFIDEAQDIAPIQREFISKLLVPGGRVIVAGDSYQAIYAFRGASFNSMEHFKASYGCTELPLSISYRCPSTVVKEAKTFVSDIESFSGVGSVSVIPMCDVSRVAVPGDMILCRFNKPLFEACISILKQGKPARILGSDVHEHLIKHADKVSKICKGKCGVQELEDYYSIHEESMTSEYKKMLLRDITDTLILVLGTAPCKAHGIKHTLERMFAEDTSAIICSTIHKAKGMESENVFLLEPEGIPCKYAEGESALQQEHNLAYVAITRAKKNLYYVSKEKGWSWRQ